MPQRAFLAVFLFLGFAAPALAQASPSPDQVEQGLDNGGRNQDAAARVTLEEIKKRPDLRAQAPSIDISTITFALNSAVIQPAQFPKVKNLALGLSRLLDREPGLLVLIEGHTDAQGPDWDNERLSRQRADALKKMLIGKFGIPASALESVGYGEAYLAFPDSPDDPRNRRVTLRRIDGLLAQQ